MASNKIRLIISININLLQLIELRLLPFAIIESIESAFNYFELLKAKHQAEKKLI